MAIFRIKKLSLEGFRSFKKSDLVFPSSNVLLLIGNNGKGKSSILDSIALLLSDFVKQIKTDKGKNYITIQASDVNTTVQKTVIDGTFEWDNQAFPIKISNPLFFKDALSKEAKKAYADFVLKFKEDNLDSNFPILVYYKSNRFFKPAKDFKFNLSSLLSDKIGEDNLLCYENAFTNQEMTFEDFQTWFRLEEDKENETFRLNQNFKLKSPKLEAIRLCIQSFFSYLEDDKTAFSDLRVQRTGTKSKLVIKKEGIEFDLEQLSDGERMLVLLVCDIARRLTLANQDKSLTVNVLQGSGIVLIDEIDMHLHPKWQRNVLPALTKTFPNIQFIASTHSLQVLGRVQRENIRVLEDGKILMVSSNPIGRDANSILEEIQHVSKRPKEIETLIDTYYTRINNNEFEEANASKNQLFNYLDSEDPIFARANAMIERKKMLMI